MKKLLVIAALLTAPFGAPLAAQAEPAQGQRIYISLAGLECSNTADAGAVIRRIEAVVRPLCMEPGFSKGHTTAGCIRAVTRDALKTLHSPDLDMAFERGSAPAGAVSPGPVSQG